MKTCRFGVYITSLLLSFFILSCSKDSDTQPDGDGAGGENFYPQDLTGTIYYDWATEGIIKVELPSGTGGSFIPDKGKLNSFDVSKDGKYRLTAVNASTLGQYDVRFTLSNLKDGGIVEEFIYNSPAGNPYCHGQLSFDNQFILVTSNDYEDGITILKTNGEFVARLSDINGERFEMNETRCWLPNNEILLTHGKYIIRSAPPYTGGKLVKQMDYEDWGDLTVNHDGTQLALRIDKHIYTLDINGEQLTQVTTSNFKEAEPVFSPDGKYLLIGSDYRQTGPFGFVWDLKIIPNDGKQYNVDPVDANSIGVIPVFWQGKDKIETAGGQVVWK
ncbi:PD40 domain-containing protein [Olivibacter sp. SDN3]|uniref:TolB family protein n=1 Tax=Olivibacter sp. SDN3 TaxID=2764720 RepID=UPI00165181F3|nr:PD40 domain-containing protein [Olivibacter sp. SDN3]QNL51650.1 PD40 domain-containing protein [Olivibacter sp. SDN3]